MIETAAIIPAFNGAERVGNIVRAALRAELVDGVFVVDDGSTDSTAVVAKEAEMLEPQPATKPLHVISQGVNRGKTEALRVGVEYARNLGGTALTTLIFLDADSLPIWSRDTISNMKLWQRAAHHKDLITPEIVVSRNTAFLTLLATYIDEMIKPVKSGEQLMHMGMYSRNFITDTVLTLMKDGAHAGNRALSIDLWDSLMRRAGSELEGWEIERALNTLAAELASQEKGAMVGTFVMHGVVNVGSRVKAGGFIPGLRRMMHVHMRAFRGMRKIRHISQSTRGR